MITRDLEQAVYERQRAARHRMVTARAGREDTVLAVTFVPPGVTSARDCQLAADLARISRAAVDQVRADMRHERMRAALRRLGEEAGR